MSKEVVISVNNISKVYKLYGSPQDRLKESLHPFRKKYHKDFYALNSLNLEIFKGETVGIIGRNGSGKSTLLKLITGVLTPTSGTIEVKGKISALLELGAGFNPELSGIENVYFNGAIIGFSREEMDSRLEDILSFADIGDFIYQPVKTYSSGMFVRLAFAVAINIEPDILIIDEALSVGDIRFRAKCFKKIEDLKDTGTTILFVSHDLGSVRTYCNRAVLMSNGQIDELGNSDDVCTSYHLKIRAEQVAEDCKATGVTVPTTTPGKILSLTMLDEKNNPIDTFESGSMLKVLVKVKAYEDITNPAVSFCIQNLQGINLLGVTTFYENVYVAPIKAGEERFFEFKLRLTIQGGSFITTVGFANQTDYDLVQVIDNYDKETITIYSKRRTFGLFAPSEATIQSYSTVPYDAHSRTAVRVGEHDIFLNLDNKHEREYYDCAKGTKTDFDILIAQRFLKENDTVLDAGANIGFSSLVFLKYGAGKVYSFEPVPYLFKRLELLKNDKLDVFQLALSDVDGTSEILLSQTHDQGHTLNTIFTDIFPNVFGASPTKTTVTTVALDTILPDIKFDFYKIDIEGSEANFVDGAKSVLSTQPPRIMMIEIYPEVFDYTHNRICQYFKFVRRAAIARDGTLQLLEVDGHAPPQEGFAKINPPIYLYCNDITIFH